VREIFRTKNLLFGKKFMYFKKFEDLTFADHYMFEKVLQNAEICQELLERLLKIKIDHLEYPEIEKTISPYYETKGVRLDVYVKDSDKVFDIELQNALDDDLTLRTRFYQSMIDIDNLLKGEHYYELPTSFVIFICKDDFFGFDLPCYSFSNTCKEKSDLSLNDESHKIFFNASAFSNEKNLEKKSILEYIVDRTSTTDFTHKLNSLVEQTKLNEIFRGDYMAWGLAEFDAEQRGKKEGYSVGLSDGISQGSQQAKIETAKNMLKDNLDIQTILKYTGLSIEDIKSLAK
jgi:predicted transposase/invertase (TIGR01784 family)